MIPTLSTCFLPNGWLVGFRDGDITFWTAPFDKPLKTVKVGLAYTNVLGVTRDAFVACGFLSLTLRALTLARARVIRVRTVTYGDEESAVVVNLGGDVRFRVDCANTEQLLAIALSPDGALLATSHLDRACRLHAMASGACLQVFRFDDAAVTSLSITSGGLLSVCQFDASKVCFMRVGSREPVASLAISWPTAALVASESPSAIDFFVIARRELFKRTLAL